MPTKPTKPSNAPPPIPDALAGHGPRTQTALLRRIIWEVQEIAKRQHKQATGKQVEDARASLGEDLNTHTRAIRRDLTIVFDRLSAQDAKLAEIQSAQASGLEALRLEFGTVTATLAEILALLKNPPIPHATDLGEVVTVEPETEGPSPPQGEQMFNITCPLPKHVKLTYRPNGPLQAAPTVNVDNDATVTPDPSNPTSGKGPFIYRIYGANPDGVTDFSFTPSNVSTVGDADPDPVIDEPITSTGVITWVQPHANTLGEDVALED